MTIYQIHLGIQQGLQKNGVFAYQDIGHDEIDLHLGLEIRAYIKDIIRSFDKPQDGYSKDTFNLTALKDILIHKNEQTGIATITGAPIGSKDATIVTDMYLPIRVYADIIYTCDKVSTTVYKRCTLREYDIVYDILDHPIQKPTRDNPTAFIYGTKVGVMTDGNFQVSKIYLDYIKTFVDPLLVFDEEGVYDTINSKQCPLYENTHLDLIERTIYRIKNQNEGNPQVLQRLKQEQIIN